METAGQNTKQVMEENDALKQLIELLNQQNMKEQSQDFMPEIPFWRTLHISAFRRKSQACRNA